MSIAALTDGLPGRTLSILSATSRGRSNVNPSKARAIVLIASIADRTVSPVTSVGAPLPLPGSEPECTTTITFWATVEDPLAIVKGSFRGRSIAAYSRKSIRIGTDTHAQRYQSTVRLSVSRPFDSGAELRVTTSSSDRNGRTRSTSTAGIGDRPVGRA